MQKSLNFSLANLLSLGIFWSPLVFWVADYESEVRIAKFKMVQWEKCMVFQLYFIFSWGDNYFLWLYQPFYSRLNYIL